MKKKNWLKSAIACLIFLTLLIQTGCGEWICGHRLSIPQVEKTVKAYLDKKYKQNFTVKVVKKVAGEENEAGLNTPNQFNVEASAGGKKYYVVYAKDVKHPDTKDIFKENIENRHWSKEADEYYSELIKKYYSDSYLVDVTFIEDHSPSRVGMTFEEYLNELNTYTTPFIDVNLAIFVNNEKAFIKNSKFLNEIDKSIRKVDNPYFSELLYVVNKKDKEEYIKKCNEYMDVQQKYLFDDKTQDIKAYNTKIKPLEDWFKQKVYDSCLFEEENYKRVYNWGMSKTP